ncbi:MAG: TIM barrel protein, partial [Armatimonadota bacterium]|nr:TIM barrel protein [Armatimonadota bacterium]
VAMGARQLRVGVPRYNGRVPYPKLRDQAVAQYHDVAALARRYGVRALIEIHMGNITPSASAAAAFVSHFDPRDVGIIHDAGNMVYEGYEQYLMGLEMLGPYLAHVHLKSAVWRPAGERPDGSLAWEAVAAPIPRGQVDVAALFRALRRVGYDEWVSFEDFSTETPLLERVRQNLAYVKQVEQAVAAETA